MILSSLVKAISGCGARSVTQWLMQLTDCSGQGLNPELACLPRIFQHSRQQSWITGVSSPSGDICQSKEHFLNAHAESDPLDLKPLPFQCSQHRNVRVGS